MVQIGNEITSGMLWDDGRVTEELDCDRQWSKLATLVKSGINGLNSVLDANDKVDVMVHIDRGGDNKGSKKFFDQMKKYAVDFDIIGLSYYPWWHGTLTDLENNLNDLSHRYEKEIILVEVAYPWTIQQDTEHEFIVQSDEKLINKYPATVDGQYEYLNDLIELIEAIPKQKGAGIYYWEPCWIPSKKEWSVGHANNWANLTLFDFEGRKLKSLDVFKNT